MLHGSKPVFELGSIQLKHFASLPHVHAALNLEEHPMVSKAVTALSSQWFPCAEHLLEPLGI